MQKSQIQKWIQSSCVLAVSTGIQGPPLTVILADSISLSYAKGKRTRGLKSTISVCLSFSFLMTYFFNAWCTFLDLHFFRYFSTCSRQPLVFIHFCIHVAVLWKLYRQSSWFLNCLFSLRSRRISSTHKETPDSLFHLKNSKSPKLEAQRQ